MSLSENSGFRAEILEKVLLLIELLEYFFNDSMLKEKIVLKGGTALNLFYLKLPRLSVDIDLNYIGEIDRKKMLLDRQHIEERIATICKLQKFIPGRKPMVHAGGKSIWRYPSVLGHAGNLAIDLNFMYRIPLLPINQKHSIKIGHFFAKNIAVLNIYELAAGKLAALVNRSLGRDLFDVYSLLLTDDLDLEIFRPIFVTYLGISNQKNIWDITPEQIAIDSEELSNRLIPMLPKNKCNYLKNKKTWVTNMLVEVQKLLRILLPLRTNEIDFLKALLNFGEIKPEMITNDLQLQKNIKSHPALHWKISNAKK